VSFRVLQLRINMAESLPRCLAAAQTMVMAMADAENARGKTTFFGSDKYIPAYRKALERISDFLGTLYEENIAETSQGDEAVMQIYREFMEFFMQAYPNWLDAYAFMERFLDSKNSPLHSELIAKHRNWNAYLSSPLITRSKTRN
jgi:hypothetical protein